MELREVAGDHIKRDVCTNCGHIHYQNPKIIVGSIVYSGDKVLLCKRNIEPRKGFWNIPAGFMENDERVEDGAAREVMEEANAKIIIERVHTVYSLLQAKQVYIHFLSKLSEWDGGYGPESMECRLFEEHEIPWNEMAFASSTFALRRYFRDLKNKSTEVHLGTYPENK